MAHVFGEAFLRKAIRLEIGDGRQFPIVRQNVAAIFFIHAPGQGCSRGRRLFGGRFFLLARLRRRGTDVRWSSSD
jgi:hypothetical protein